MSFGINTSSVAPELSLSFSGFINLELYGYSSVKTEMSLNNKDLYERPSVDGSTVGTICPWTLEDKNTVHREINNT